MIHHFIVEPYAAPRQWNPRNPGPELPRDCLYFGKALVEMEQHLFGEEINCYLTWDNDSLPEYGPHVVAILIGEEWGPIPRYARHVRLVARVMSRYPFFGVRKWFPLHRLNLQLGAKFLRNWSRHLRSWWRYKTPPSWWPGRVHNKASIVHLPWGSASLVEVPMKSMRERTGNYYFSGAIALGSDFGYRKFTSSPKILARQSLVKAVAELEKKYPSLASDQTVKVHEQTSTGKLSDIEDDAQRLMDSKICLAPRGSVADTWRFFEGLKSGCAVITNPLPDEWYYRARRSFSWIAGMTWKKRSFLCSPTRPGSKKMHSQSLKYWKSLWRASARSVPGSCDFRQRCSRSRSGDGSGACLR